MTEYNIIPVAKPRMTRADKWKRRECVLKYWAFKDECLEAGVVIENNQDITFVLPMPKSWGKKHKTEQDGEPHQSKKDLDNLLKALWDACCDEDQHLHTVTARKVWGYEGKIIID